MPVQPPSSRAVTRSSSISQSAAIDPFLQNEPADFESQQEVVAAAVATLGALKAAGSTETAFTRKAAEPLNKRPRTTKSSKPGTTQSQRCPPPMEPHKRAAPHSPVTTRHSCAPCVTVVSSLVWDLFQILPSLGKACPAVAGAHRRATQVSFLHLFRLMSLSSMNAK